MEAQRPQATAGPRRVVAREKRGAPGRDQSRPLEHDFDARLVGEKGCRIVDSNQEAEARELGAELLVPAEAALVHARRESDDLTVAAALKLASRSPDGMNYTEARKIAARKRAKYARLRGKRP